MSQEKKIGSHKIFIIKENAGYWRDVLRVRALAAPSEDRFSSPHPHSRSELPAGPVPWNHHPLLGLHGLLNAHGTHKLIQVHAHAYQMNKQINLLKENAVKEGKNTRRTVVAVSPSV